MDSTGKNGFGKNGLCFHIYHLQNLEKKLKYSIGKTGLHFHIYHLHYLEKNKVM